MRQKAEVPLDRAVKVPQALVDQIRKDYGDKAVPGVILSRAYESYRQLRVLKEILKESSQVEGEDVFQVIKNWVALSEEENQRLRDQNLSYELMFAGLRELVEKDPQLRLALVTLVNEGTKRGGPK